MAGWVETGTNMTTSDTVGVGTTAPQSTLHANGTVTIGAGSGPLPDGFGRRGLRAMVNPERIDIVYRPS